MIETKRLRPPVTLWDGFGSFLRGFSLLVGSPGAIPYALVPMVAAVAITLGLSTVSAFTLPILVERYLGETELIGAAKIVATLLALVLSVFLGLVLAQPASGPALEQLVRRVEKTLGEPERSPTPFIVDVARAAGSAILGLTGAAIVLGVLLVLGLIPGAAFITVPLKIISTAVFIGWDLCDYPLSVRGMPLRERVAFIGRHLRPVLGFAAGIALFALVPCGFLLILPVGICGATDLVTRLEAQDGRSRVGHRPV